MFGSTRLKDRHQQQYTFLPAMLTVKSTVGSIIHSDPTLLDGFFDVPQDEVYTTKKEALANVLRSEASPPNILTVRDLQEQLNQWPDNHLVLIKSTEETRHYGHGCGGIMGATTEEGQDAVVLEEIHSGKWWREQYAQNNTLKTR